tara:strand:+ start:1848 stop:2879 length:1032 start_codon:yes stop_codon:yes gene_type:complete
MDEENHNPVLGSLLGTAVGDALGLPYEGLKRGRVRAFGVIRHRFLFGRGMFSDDTEHTLMLASALIEARDGVDECACRFGRKLRWWLAGLPAGVGLSTARAIFKLWIGFPVARSGVRSAGNGAAMRSPILGVVFRNEPSKRREFTAALCRVTHTDPRAEESAALVAEAAAMAANRISSAEVIAKLETLVVSNEMESRFATLKKCLASEKSVLMYADDIFCSDSVSGFAPNTVSVALYAWLRHRGNFETAVRSVIECGGDTDTVAAIAGGICGAEEGEKGIPMEWIEKICDWPRSVGHIGRVADALDSGATTAPRLFWPVVIVRNLVFLIAVLLHGFRRLLPPY